jgi:hypothetical protein
METKTWWKGVASAVDTLDSPSEAAVQSPQLRAVQEIIRTLEHDCKSVSDVLSRVYDWVVVQKDHFLYHEKRDEGLSVNTLYAGEPVLEDLVRIALYIALYTCTGREYQMCLPHIVFHSIMYPETVAFLDTKEQTIEPYTSLIHRYSTSRLAALFIHANGKRTRFVPTALIEAFLPHFQRALKTRAPRGIPLASYGAEGVRALLRYGLVNAHVVDELSYDQQFVQEDVCDTELLYMLQTIYWRERKTTGSVFLHRLMRNAEDFKYFIQQGSLQMAWFDCPAPAPSVLDAMEELHAEGLHAPLPLTACFPVDRSNASWFIQRRRLLTEQNVFRVWHDFGLYTALGLRGLIPDVVHVATCRYNRHAPNCTLVSRNGATIVWGNGFSGTTAETLLRYDPSVAEFLL